MSGFVSLENVLNRWVSGALPPTPLGSLQRSQDPLAGGQKNTSSQEPHTVWAIRASLFSPSGLVISVDPHSVVCGSAVMQMKSGKAWANSVGSVGAIPIRAQVPVSKSQEYGSLLQIVLQWFAFFQGTTIFCQLSIVDGTDFIRKSEARVGSFKPNQFPWIRHWGRSVEAHEARAWEVIWVGPSSNMQWRTCGVWTLA